MALALEETLARLECVRPCARGWVARCPAHVDRDPSLSICEGDNGTVLFKCFAGCSYHAIIDALGIEPVQERAPRSITGKPTGADDRERVERARRIWRDSCDPRGTVVQDYLFGRGFTGELPCGVDSRVSSQMRRQLRVGLGIPASIRFHPRLKHPSGAYLPAMVAAIDDLGGAIVGVHRTFIKPDGTGKADAEPQKMALGRLRRCAVHLSAGDRSLVLCEGVETGLSVLQATGLHVWAALGTSNLAQIDLPGFAREIIIAADNDDPGMKAARAAAESYRTRGLRVQILRPRNEQSDWNDIARRADANQRG